MEGIPNVDFDNQSMTLEEAITIIREIDPSAEETNSRRAETLILQAVHDGANVEFPSDNISLHMVDAKYVAHLEQEAALWMDWLKAPVEVDNG